MAGDNETFQPQVKFVCPFCQRLAYAGKDADGNQGLLHERPECDEFQALPPLEYLAQVRQHYQRETAN